MIEEDKKALHKVIKEISDSFARTQGEREFVKSAVSDASEKYQLSKKVIRKIAKTYFLQNLTKEVEEMQEFMEQYETILGTKVD